MTQWIRKTFEGHGYVDYKFNEQYQAYEFHTYFYKAGARKLIMPWIESIGSVWYALIGADNTLAINAITKGGFTDYGLHRLLTETGEELLVHVFIYETTKGT